MNRNDKFIPRKGFSGIVASVFSLLALCVSCEVGAEPSEIEPLIRVNQIGYVPNGNKVAVIADPQAGPNAEEAFDPGSTYQVRRWEDDAVVLEGSPVAWNGGATHAQSGDRGWWFDFSELTEPGHYYVWDAENAVGSYGFAIGEDVYDEVFKAAIRTYFYQRLGFEKEAEFAGEAWADGAAFVGPGQDGEARSVYDRNNPDTARDLSGGWMDAGDYNKYVTFAEPVVHQLLSAYSERPEAFGDDYNLPESGNGLPDVLDEVRFEMLWMSRMQEEDGGVLQKMGEIDYNGVTPPSADTRPRYYVPACSSSTIAAAGMYAHAALVFGQFEPWQDFANQLEAQAELAWEWYHANPKSENCDEGIVKSGDADRSLADQEKSALAAAIYLHQLTGDEGYETYVRDNYIDPDVELDGWSGRWVYVPALYDALQSYMAFPSAPEEVIDAVKAKMLSNVNESFFAWTDADLYQAHMPDDQYHWGSNSVRSNMANASYNYVTFEVEGVDLDERRLRTESMLHYMLGVNPLGLVYLSNLEDYGAEKSVSEFYHSWFRHGSEWDLNPPPGYVPGGPNKNYTGNYPGLADAPPQKAYAEINGGYSNTWELTENGIYYQSAFIKMLSKFVSSQAVEADTGDDDGDGVANSFEDYFGTDRNARDTLAGRFWLEIAEGGSLHLFFWRSLGLPFTLVELQASGDLSAWETLDLRDSVTVETADGMALQRLAVEEMNGVRFLRFAIGGE